MTRPLCPHYLQGVYCISLIGKARGYGPNPFELGGPSFHQDFETMSNFSWDAMSFDNLSDFSEEDWEDLESAYTHDTIDYELDQDLKLLRATRSASDSGTPSPSSTPPRRTYAQALVNST